MDQSLHILLETAAIECKKGNFQQGIHLYSKYIQANSYDAKAHYLRAKAYFQLKDYNAAISDLNKALALEPNDPHLIGERALTYFMANNKDSAMKDFDRAIELEPNNPFRYASRAFIKDRMNDLNGAKQDYQEAIKLDPEDAISFNNLGMVLEKLGNKDKADKHFKSAARLDPKNFGMNTQKNNILDKKMPPIVEKSPATMKINEKTSANLTTKKLLETMLSLFTSKDERKAFWRFIKDKFQ